MATTALPLEQTQKKGIRWTLAMCCLFIAAVGFGFYLKFTAPRILSPQELRANNVWIFETARIPRDFELVNQDGQPATNAIFTGKWTLVFFGFTHCPDICPSALAQMRDMKKMLDDQGRGDDVQFMLVSVDPDRDTPEMLGPYIRFFDEDFLALTGDYQVLKRLGTDFNVAFSKVNQGEGMYTVDHSGNIAIVNPFGHYQGFIRPPFNPSQMTLMFNSVRASWQY